MTQNNESRDRFAQMAADSRWVAHTSPELYVGVDPDSVMSASTAGTRLKNRSNRPGESRPRRGTGGQSRVTV